MSLKALIEDINNKIKLDQNDPEIKRRNEEAYKRLAEWDKESEARIKARTPTQIQLNRTIDI